MVNRDGYCLDSIRCWTGTFEIVPVNGVCYVSFLLTVCTATLHLCFHRCWSIHIFHCSLPQCQSFECCTRHFYPWSCRTRNFCCKVQKNVCFHRHLSSSHPHGPTHSYRSLPTFARKVQCLARIVNQTWIECKGLICWKQSTKRKYWWYHIHLYHWYRLGTKFWYTIFIWGKSSGCHFARGSMESQKTNWQNHN